MATLRSGGATAVFAGELPTPEQLSTLAERIRDGEPSAEEELVHTFQHRIAFLVRMRTRDPGAAQDLASTIRAASRSALPAP